MTASEAECEEFQRVVRECVGVEIGQEEARAAIEGLCELMERFAAWQQKAEASGLHPVSDLEKIDFDQ